MKFSNIARDVNIKEMRQEYAFLLSEITNALQDEMEKKNITRSDLARLLGKDKGFITRKLSADENITVQVIAAMVYAIGGRMEVSVRDISGMGPMEGNGPHSIDRISENRKAVPLGVSHWGNLETAGV